MLKHTVGNGPSPSGVLTSPRINFSSTINSTFINISHSLLFIRYIHTLFHMEKQLRLPVFQKSVFRLSSNTICLLTGHLWDRRKPSNMHWQIHMISPSFLFSPRAAKPLRSSPLTTPAPCSARSLCRFFYRKSERAIRMHKLPF